MPSLAFTVQHALSADQMPSRQRLRSWARAALLGDAQVTLRLVGGREGRALNRNFRGKDYATNVLTFVYEANAPRRGDIVLCVTVLAREARAQRKPVESHYAHMLVHGMLHLQGYDHERIRDARIMEAIESEIVMKLGYADPYETR